MTQQIVLTDIIQGGWRDCAFEHFRDGIEICRLFEGAPDVALLRYRPGATVPRHRHAGLEMIVVLEGSQRDENGVARAGAVVLNPEGTVHSVSTDDGCVVLIQWERPVEFL